MPRKGFQKEDGVRGRREKNSKVFPFFPDHTSTFMGNKALFYPKVICTQKVGHN